MRYKLFRKRSANGEWTHPSDSYTPKNHTNLSFDEYVKWVNGEPILCHHNTITMEQYSSDGLGEYIVNTSDKTLTADKLTPIYFTFNHPSDVKSTKEYLFIDIDAKAMVDENNNKLTDEELIAIKEEIIQIVTFYPEISNKVLSLVRSGVKATNGLHIMIKGDNFDSKYNREYVTKNLLGYIQSLTTTNLHFSDRGVMDTSASSSNRLQKTLFGIGFEHLNPQAVWDKDFTFKSANEVTKLNVPNELTHGFHNELFAYMAKTTGTLESYLKLYEDDLGKRPFSANKTFGQELTRLYNWYSKKGFTDNRTIQSEAKMGLIGLGIIYTDKGKIKIVENKLVEYIFDKYEFMYDGETDGVYVRKNENGENWELYTKSNVSGTHNMSTIIASNIGMNLGIETISLIRNTIQKHIDFILMDKRVLPIDITRDLDTEDYAVFEINNDKKFYTIKVEEKNITILPQKASMVNKSIHIPFSKLDLTYDYKDWDVYKSGFFHNVTKDYDTLIRIIGKLNHLSKGTRDGGRIVVLTDANLETNDQGGNGKSLLAKISTSLRRTSIYTDNRSKKNSSFPLQNCDNTTQILYIDEMRKESKIEDWRYITDSNNPVEINKKFMAPIEIEPLNMIICTNYKISEHESDVGRRIEVEFQRYYKRDVFPLDTVLGYKVFSHSDLKAGKNFNISVDYKNPYTLEEIKETRTINGNDWWNGYIAFIFHCVQEYLKNRHKRMPNIVDENRSITKSLENRRNNNPALADAIDNSLSNVNVMLKDSNFDYVLLTNDDIRRSSELTAKLSNSELRTSYSSLKYWISEYVQVLYPHIVYTHNKDIMSEELKDKGKTIRKDTVYHYFKLK